MAMTASQVSPETFYIALQKLDATTFLFAMDNGTGAQIVPPTILTLYEASRMLEKAVIESCYHPRFHDRLFKGDDKIESNDANGGNATHCAEPR